MIDFYTRAALRLKRFQALWIAIWAAGIVGAALTATSTDRRAQLLLGFVFVPMFCFGWSLLLTCLWFHPQARMPNRGAGEPSGKQLSRMAAIITLLLVCGAVLGPASVVYGR